MAPAPQPGTSTPNPAIIVAQKAPTPRSVLSSETQAVALVVSAAQAATNVVFPVPAPAVTRVT